MSIKDRDEGNQKRKERLAKIKRGPGVFVYDGSAMDTTSTPTHLLMGKNVPVLDERGLPVCDKSGRQIYENAGAIVRDSDGTPKLGGIPKVERKAIDVWKLRDVSFPKGVAVKVNDHSLALKLRCLSQFEEVEAGDDKPEPETIEDFLELSKPELIERAKALDVDTKGLNKRDIAAALVEASK